MLTRADGSLETGHYMKKHAPTIAISFLKNFFARKYTGIAVNTEKITAQIL